MEFIAEKRNSILECLQGLFPESSLNTLRGWIKSGRVSIEDKRVPHGKIQVEKGARVIIGPKVYFLKNGTKVLYQDEALIVLEKPEGLLSVATDFDREPSLHMQLKRHFHRQRIFPVHRLDRDTSGVIVFAFTENAQKRLKEQFEAHAVEKEYCAIVEGKWETQKGTWESYLEEDALYSVHATSNQERGKLAITHYEKIGESSGKTLLRLRPVTGRKHQLRVHCKEAGLPILGDKRYGSEKLGDKRYGSGKKNRLYLHALQIQFTHPLSLKKMTFTTPLPLAFTKELQKPLRR